MRCGCPNCGTYMIQSEGSELGCVCPDCLYRCKACLGTDSAVSRDEILAMKKLKDDIDREKAEEKNKADLTFI